MGSVLYRGCIVSPSHSGDFIFLPDGAMVVSKSGKIEFVGAYDSVPEAYTGLEINDCSASLILPGFIDLHTHLPQYPVAGQGQGPLLDWLNKTIFPQEARFVDKNYARKISRYFFNDMLSFGTTTALIYSAPFENATDIAFREAENAGLRIYMGMTMMDMGAPDYLTDDTKNVLDAAERLMEKWTGSSDGMLNYIMTPRYAGSCSLELMKKAAEIAKANDLFVQTHIAENTSELSYISSLYPEFTNYTEIYDKCGIISDNCILAHAIHLSEDEIKLLLSKGAKITHCPCSNRYLSSGIMPLKEMMSNGFEIGLGTDVAGSFSLSMINEMKEAIESSKTIAHFSPENSELILEEGLQMATLKGAEILGIEKQTGSLEEGKNADFIIINYDPPFMELKNSSLHDILSHIIYRLDSLRVEQTYISGKRLYRKC